MMHAIFRSIKRRFVALLTFTALFFLTSCENHMVIINDVNEREANEIVVFLASKGIAAEKMASANVAPGAASTTIKWNIAVPPSQANDAMAILNQNGLPRQQGTNLLDLFAKSGLMSSDKEETIRYQAGLAQQIANMIRKIDGVIDADVQLSFPQETSSTVIPGGTSAPPAKITAAVYVKHQGILDDPNSYLVIKIKRLVSGSVAGLDINDVTVISDRSRFTDVSLTPQIEPLEAQAKEYVSIWSIVMSKSSAGRFRVIFFFLTVFTILLAIVLAWMVWKFYPILKRRGGLKALLSHVPIRDQEGRKETEESDESTK
jgi:type III secretion protein J